MEYFVLDKHKKDSQEEDWVNAKAQTVAAAVDDLGPFIRGKRADAGTQYGETADGGRGRAGERERGGVVAFGLFSI